MRRAEDGRVLFTYRLLFFPKHGDQAGKSIDGIVVKSGFFTLEGNDEEVSFNTESFLPFNLKPFFSLQNGVGGNFVIFRQSESAAFAVIKHPGFARLGGEEYKIAQAVQGRFSLNCCLGCAFCCGLDYPVIILLLNLLLFLAAL